MYIEGQEEECIIPERKRGPQANAGNRKAKSEIYMSEATRGRFLAEARKKGVSLSKFMVFATDVYIDSN